MASGVPAADASPAAGSDGALSVPRVPELAAGETKQCGVGPNSIIFEAL